MEKNEKQTKNVKLSFECKKEMLKDLFEELVNPDKGLSTRKCIMQDWYEIRHGLRNGSETLVFGLRERDGSLCVFEKLPHGTDDADHVHVFDNYPSLEIIPKENNAGFSIKMRARDKHSSETPNEIEVLNEITLVLTDFGAKYQLVISDASS
jgi:hypothetical protein